METYPSAPLIEPAEIFFQHRETPPQPAVSKRSLPDEIRESLRLMTESLVPSADIPMESLEMEDATEFEAKPFKFRGLGNAPVNKSGVIYLFATIQRELGYSISTFLPGCPDCKGERCVDRPNNRWEQVNFHFEYKSSDFRCPVRRDGARDILVCWLHDLPSAGLDVLELRSTIQQLPSR